MRNNLKYDFVIITPGRSGSWYLLETLDNYEDISMDGEVFDRSIYENNSFNVFLRSNLLNRLIAFLFNRQSFSRSRFNFPLKYLIQSYLLPGESSHLGLKGFKISLDQLEAYPQVEKCLADSNCKAIYLNREDKLIHAVSFLRARKTGLYNIKKKDINVGKIRLNPEQVISQIAESECQEKAFFERGRFKKVVSISYESLFEDQITTLSSIRAFLDLPIAEMKKSTFVQVTPSKTEEWLENWQEIKTSFDKNNTKFKC
ncbi:Stf0 family sulfotransferase [Reichenbachiella versicolor]|uniref:Stf0 family sulfotransferase n=1 Tax=Reichenbachiella versicolor TaxID=1821036 RepID=UPI000D6E1A09|nr:Stf0 family sulfotransferase [Reichenbachiella versicolor]